MSTFDDAWLQTVLQRGHVRVVGEASRRERISADPHEPPMTQGDVGHAVSLYRSGLERRYADLLAQWQVAGTLVRFRYEAERLLLAPQTTILVDFLLTFADGHMERHEVKGKRWLGATGRAKLKCAAVLWPEYIFVLVEWKDSQWRWKKLHG